MNANGGGGHAPHGATTIRASRGGGGAGKWLLAGLAAAVLAGGGYYAWKNYAPAQTDAQAAYNDTYDTEDPVRTGPLEDESSVSAEAASTSEAPAAAATETTAPVRRTTARTRQTAETVVPEETIGITPVAATTSSSGDDSDIVVTARRPVWIQTPSQHRLSSLYPARALERGREGEASLHCIVQDGGALGCETVSATPGGFDSAAQRVARTFRHSTQLADGSTAIGTPVNLRVVFRINDERQHG